MHLFVFSDKHGENCWKNKKVWKMQKKSCTTSFWVRATLATTTHISLSLSLSEHTFTHQDTLAHTHLSLWHINITLSLSLSFSLSLSLLHIFRIFSAKLHPKLQLKVAIKQKTVQQNRFRRHHFRTKTYFSLATKTT